MRVITSLLTAALLSGCQAQTTMSQALNGVAAALAGAETGADTQPAIAPQALEAQLARAYPDAADIIYVADGVEALAFVYTPFPGGNAMSLETPFYSYDGARWRRTAVVENLFGSDPRDAVFGADQIVLTTTMPRAGDPRCCPTGATHWTIDRRTMRASS